MQNINVGNKPIHDGDTVQVDHIITTITVMIRSMGAVSPDLIKDLIQTKYEVTDIGITNQTVAVKKL